MVQGLLLAERYLRFNSSEAIIKRSFARCKVTGRKDDSLQAAAAPGLF